MTSGVYVRQSSPLGPIEVVWWGDGRVELTKVITDERALQIAADILGMLANNRASRMLAMNKEI